MDALADKYNISISENKHKALCGKGVIEGMKVDAGEAADLYELKR